MAKDSKTEPVDPPTEPDPSTPDALAAYDKLTVELLNEKNAECRDAITLALELKQRASDAKKSADGHQAELRILIADRKEWRGRRRPTEVDLFSGVKPDPDNWRALPVTCLKLDGPTMKIVTEAGVKTVGHLDEWVSSDADGFGTSLNSDQYNAVTLEIKEAGAGKRNPVTTVDPLAELWKTFPIAGWTEYGLTESDVKKLHEGVVKRTNEVVPIVTVGDLNRFVTPNAANPSFTRGYQDIKGLGPAGVDRVSEAETKFWAAWERGLKDQFAKEQGHGVPPATDGEGDDADGDRAEAA